MSSSWSGRAVVGMWWLVALIVARSYSSALTSMLAVRTVPVKYNYLRQVIGDPDIHLIFEKATALVEHMSVCSSLKIPCENICLICSIYYLRLYLRCRKSKKAK